MNIIDIAVIGQGPAGLSAAINAVQRNRSVMVFGRDLSTSWLYKAEKVNNHLGMPEMTGKEMLDTFKNHVESAGIEIKSGRVMQILPMGEFFGINFENDFYQAKTVIIASGISKGKKIKGEEEFTGKGVSYCATCDGMLYRGKEVMVVSEIEEGEEDIHFLSNLAGKVYYANYDKNSSFESEKAQDVGAKVKEVYGNEFVEGVVLDNGEKVAVNGVFFVKASTPLDSLIAGIETENNAIKVDRLMQTNIPGVFAAGDCTGWPFQVSNAIGEGLIAAQQADRYISAMEKAGSNK